MFYDNKVCEGCSELMLEGDDIVVCPECGTPQHRECYSKNNECVNAHLHAEGFDWKEAHKEPPAEESAEESADFSASENAEEPSDAPPRAEYSSFDGVPPMPEFRVDGIYIKGRLYQAEEDIGGATVKEASTYTQINFRHYIKKFAKRKFKKDSFFLSWNWGAFFFGPAWFFYRKLYKLGAIFLALAVSATMAVSPFLVSIANAGAELEPLYSQWYDALSKDSAESTEETQAEVDRLSAEITAIARRVMPQTFAVLGTYAIAHFIPALIANFFYRKKMLEDIKFAKQATSDVEVLKYSLIRRGGVSILAGLVASLAVDYLPSIILSFIN